MELFGAKRTAFAIPRLQEKSVTAVITEIEKYRKNEKSGKRVPLFGGLSPADLRGNGKLFAAKTFSPLCRTSLPNMVKPCSVVKAEQVAKVPQVRK